MNLTNEQVNVIRKVSRSLAPCYTFGYYDAEDIEQECFIIALEALPKYNPDQGSLENFLYTHISNRLKNFLRKHYYRRTFGCSVCHGKDPNCEHYERRRWKFAAKKHLMEPIDLNHINCDNESNAYTTCNILENMELAEVFSIINSHLEVHLRADYLKMLDGVHVPKNRRHIIESRIIEILSEYDYGE
jgi:RNA polymerase sigma factor (sigma-70 family)